MNTILSNIIIVLVITIIVSYSVTHAACFLWDKFWSRKVGPIARYMEHQPVWFTLIVSFSSALATLYVMFGTLGL